MRKPRRVDEPERRGLVREQPESETKLQLQLRTSDADFAGRVVDVTLQGMGVVFDCDPSPTLAAGTSVQLIISEPQLRLPLELDAVVIDRVDYTASRRYGFRIAYSAEIEKLLPRPLFALFTRRRQPRVQMRPDVRLGALLTTLNGRNSEVFAWIKDLSVAGMAVIASGRLDVGIPQPSRLRSSFLIPDTKALIELDAWIRNSSPHSRGIRYGLEFDPVTSRSFESQKEKLREYVAKSQRERPQH